VDVIPSPYFKRGMPADLISNARCPTWPQLLRPPTDFVWWHAPHEKHI